MRMTSVLSIVMVVVVALCVTPEPAHAIAVGTEIVLLADVSGSLDSTDFSLQRDGYVAAFRDAGVISAIMAHGPIAVSLVYWSTGQSIAVPWSLISDSVSANAFADAILAAPRSSSGSTYLGDAMDYAAGLYANNGFEGRRLVLDVSGDGADNEFDEFDGDMVDENVQAARANLLNNAGVDTINALWIDDRSYFGDDPEDWVNALDYGIVNVIGGNSPFQYIVQDYPDFEVAIRNKIQREVTPTPDAGCSVILLSLALSGVGLLRRRIG